MGRLHKVASGLAIVLSSIGLSGVASASPKCSLRVRVVSPDGRRPEAPISVRERDGHVTEKDQEEGDVSFCDLGILPVDVTVGSDGMCNQVTVRDVPISLERSYVLQVTYDPDACTERIPPPVPVCDVLFRVSDTNGDWLPGATVALKRQNGPEKHTDEYGRAELVIRLGETISGSVGHQGFQSAPFSLSCTRSGPRQEKRISLQSRAGQ